MNFKIGICLECKTEKPLANAHYQLCGYHNMKRLQVGKERPKRKRVIRKATGEGAMFKLVWSSRPHICENCKQPIREARAWNFSHKKSKSTHPEKRLDPANIQILCLECHRLYDQGSKESYNKRTR